MKTFHRAFEAHYRREFGFVIVDRPILIDDLRVRAVGHTRKAERSAIEKSSAAPEVSFLSFFS